MTDLEYDKLFINDLVLKCIIGTNEWERHKKQKVIINLTLYTDVQKACSSDNLKDTVNYMTIKKKILELTEGSSYFLIEKLAQEITEIALAEDLVWQVRVRIDKPAAFKKARSAAVEIFRRKEPFEGN